MARIHARTKTLIKYVFFFTFDAKAEHILKGTRNLSIVKNGRKFKGGQIGPRKLQFRALISVRYNHMRNTLGQNNWNVVM